MDIPMTVTIPEAAADVTLVAPDERHPRIDLIIGRKIDSSPNFGITDLMVVTGIASAEPAMPEIDMWLAQGYEIVQIVRREPERRK